MSKSRCELEMFYEIAKDYGSELAGPPECCCEKCSWKIVNSIRNNMGEWLNELEGAEKKVSFIRGRLADSMRSLTNILNVRKKREDRIREAQRVLKEEKSA